MSEWVIYNNHIALKNGEQITHLSAADVYEVLGSENDGNTLYNGELLPALRTAFPNVVFSKIGTNVRCILSQEKESILVRVFCERKGNQLDLDVVDGRIIDQCISGNEWFYVTGDTEELTDLFKGGDILSAGRISLKQYLYLIQNNDNDGRSILTNEVIIKSDNKPLCLNDDHPAGLNATLYPYQQTGYAWMSYMMKEINGCILGDEMGLGKTIQVITLMLEYVSSGKIPMLVIAPVSLLQNWLRECERFAPGMNVLIHHGASRTGRYKELENKDVVVVSYTTAVHDASLLKMVQWKMVVLDEAQNIKNPASERTRMVKQIPRTTSIAVTGTPFENHVSDIWSLIDFISPGTIGTLAEYNRAISDDLLGANKIEPVLSALMVRRLVKDVAKDLPEKVIIPVPMLMSPRECDDYETIRKETVGAEKTGSLGIAALQKLRMYCTHPQVYEETETGEDPCSGSIKYQRMCELLEEIIARDEKVILFASYTKMFSILENDIPRRFGIPTWSIYGETPVTERQGIIDRFNDLTGSALLVLNPRAAGVGLNITAANHVIHYNLEWNPALEDQASARSYRRGQTKTVFIYRLYYESTVEEIVNDRLERKRDIADIAVIGTDGESENREDIIRALELSPI